VGIVNLVGEHNVNQLQFTDSIPPQRSPLRSSGQSSWLQIRRPGFDSRHYQAKKVVGLEQGPLSLVSTTEELLGRKVAAPVYKTDNTAVGTRHADHVAPYICKKLAITSPTSGGHSVGIVRSRTQTMELVSYTSTTPNYTAYSGHSDRGIMLCVLVWKDLKIWLFTISEWVDLITISN
jgi:hypothetical protein